MLPLRVTPARGCLLLWLAAGGTAAWAQSGGAGLVPALDVSISHVAGQRPEPNAAGAGLVAEVRPSLRYATRSGRLQGSLSYGLGLVRYSQPGSRFQAQHQLAASFQLEAIERQGYVDLTAAVGRQALSPYGLQSSAANQAGNANLLEVANVTVSPHFTARLGEVATLDLRLNAAAVNTRRSVAGDAVTTGGSLAVSSARGGARLGWGLTASATTTEPRAGARTTNDKALASLSYRPDPDLSLLLRAGHETASVLGGQRQGYQTTGAGLRWLPSVRTVAELNVDQRYFGRSHALTLSHRLPLSSVRYTSQRDVILAASPPGPAGPLTLYQLFFEQFASQEPDPVLREQLVLAFLLGQGQDPTATVGGAYVSTGPQLQQRHDLALSYGAKRLTLALQAFANRSGLLAAGAAIADGAQDLRQRGYNGTVSYRLTPTASFGLNGSRLMTKPTPVQGGTDLKSLTLSLTDRLGRHSTVSLSARYSVFNSSLNPYRESALKASLATRF